MRIPCRQNRRWRSRAAGPRHGLAAASHQAVAPGPSCPGSGPPPPGARAGQSGKAPRAPPNRCRRRHPAPACLRPGRRAAMLGAGIQGPNRKPAFPRCGRSRPRCRRRCRAESAGVQPRRCSTLTAAGAAARPRATGRRAWTAKTWFNYCSLRPETGCQAAGRNDANLRSGASSSSAVMRSATMIRQFSKMTHFAPRQLPCDARQRPR